MERSLTDLLQAALVSTRGVWKILAIVVLCLLVGAMGGAILAFLAPLYTVAFIIALVAVILVLRDTQWGFIGAIAVACLLPFAALPLDVGFEPTFLDLALIGVFFVWINRIAARQQGAFITSPLAVPIVLFVIILVAAMVASLGHSSLTTTFVRRFAELILGILTYFAVINCVRTRKQLETLVTALIIAGFAAAFIGIVLYFLPESWSIRILSALRVLRYPAGSGVLRYVEDNPDLSLRAISTSQDPNVLGGLLILVGGLTIPQVLSEKPLIPKKLSIPMAGAMVLCLVLTFSRGALGGLAAGIGLISALRYRKLFWFLLLGAAMILLLPQSQDYVAHLIEGIRFEDLATQMRIGEYSDAIKVVMSHPWLGVGFSGTPEIYLYVGVSNVYLLIAEEAGIMALVIFLVTIGIFFAHMRRAALKSANDTRLDPILWGFIAALVGLLSVGMLDHYFFNLDFPHAVTLFWMYLGLAMVTARMIEPAELAQRQAMPRTEGTPVDNRLTS